MSGTISLVMSPWLGRSQAQEEPSPVILLNNTLVRLLLNIYSCTIDMSRPQPWLEKLLSVVVSS